MLLLPSSLTSLKFKCTMTISYIEKGEGRLGEDIRRVVEWEIHQTARAVSSQYSLTASAYLHMALNDTLNDWRWAKSGSLGLRAECAPVKSDPQELALARELEQAQFEMNMEAHLHETRIRNAERLGRLLSEPRLAALWWFARYPDRVEDLPRITETMYALDRLLNHRPAAAEIDDVSISQTAEPTGGDDLDRFLGEASAEKRTLLCNSLAFAYDQLGRPEMAERARALTDLGRSEETAEGS